MGTGVEIRGARPKMRARGAQHNLKQLITRHVFVLCPNNSGSTMLSRALAECRGTWTLPREGQQAFGYTGPKRDVRLGQFALLWAHAPSIRAGFADPASYDWATNRKAWYFQATSADAAAQVFVEKTPYHLLVADQLAQAFVNPFFLIMVRNPYATVEGILRRRHVKGASRAELIAMAAAHVGACFEAQQKNVEAQADRSLAFTYEGLCQDPEAANARIHAALPELHDIQLDRRRPIKGIYDEPLRDMNADQIARLSAEDIAAISAALLPHQQALAAFGYSFLEP